MKKQIIKPDGVVEEIEGTAEELAEYEKKLKEDKALVKNVKNVLLGKNQDVRTKEALHGS